MAQKPSPSAGPIVPRKELRGGGSGQTGQANFQNREIYQSQKKSFIKLSAPRAQSVPLRGAIYRRGKDRRVLRAVIKRFFKSCIIFVIIILVLLVLGITYVASASGLLYIPGISKVLYKNPEPVRKVVAEELNSEGIKNRVTKEVSRGNDRVEVFITEGNLTSIINNTQREEQKLNNIQVAIFDNGEKLEVFGKMPNSNVYLSVAYNIGKDFEGNFKIENIANFKVGNIQVPLILFSQNLFNEDSIKNLTAAAVIEDALSDDGAGLKILDIKFSEGKIIEFVSLSEDNNIESTLEGETSFDTKEQSTEIN